MAVLITVQIALLFITVVGKTEQERNCPPWFKTANTTWRNTTVMYCACSPRRSAHIECDQIQQQSSLRLASCVFYDSQTNDVLAAPCPFLFPKHMIKNNVIPLPQKMNELNTIICGNLSREMRRPLCGKCINGTGPSIYSIGNECVPCSPVNVVYYLLLQYLPTTVIVLVVVVFRLNVTAAPMAHYLLFCNILVLHFKFIVSYYTNFISSAYYLLKFLSMVVLTLCAVWSFDALFFVSPPLCISPHMEDIYKPFIDFLATLYPFILLLLMYIGTELHARDFKPIVIMWKPFHRYYIRFYTAWGANASMIQAFSSLFFLSYAKLIFLICLPILRSVVVNSEGKVMEKMVYVDPTLHYWSKKHIYIIALSLFLGIFLFLPPLILLIIYPTSLYGKISRHLKPRWRIAIKAYVETFQGCYKDGTNGTWDYRAVSGYLLAIGFLPAVQAILIALLLNVVKNRLTITLQFAAIIYTSLTIICALTRPYKHKIANVSAVILLALLVTIVALFASFDGRSDVTRALFLIQVSSPHCALIGYVVWKIVKRYYWSRRRKNERAWLLRIPINTAE